MSDYRSQVDDCTKLSKTMRERGLLRRTKTVYVTPSGGEYHTLQAALKYAPVLRKGEYEPIFDRCEIIGYRKLTNGQSED
jgi:hypothetical protein